MNTTLKNKTAIVTGAGQGIGFAICQHLISAGAKVILNDADPLLANQAAENLGPHCIPVPGDAADIPFTRHLVNTCVRQFGRLDILIANAGISKAARLADLTSTDLDNLYNTNLRWTFLLVQQIVPLLHSGSSITVITSLAAHSIVGNPGIDNPSVLAYASTKGALETLVKNWAAILGPQGIRVNAVAPGIIDTDMSNFTKTEAGRQTALNMQALKRIGKPDDVADIVTFIASDAARWITGATIPADGGSKL